MRRRLLAALAALVLAVLGGMVLVGYARGADARAMAGMKTAAVLVVTQQIPQGTPGDKLMGKIRLEAVPVKAAAPGHVTDLASLKGEVTTVDLQPGEQLLSARFAAPSSLQTPGTVAVPAGDQEISVLLEPQRAIGGRIAAGNKVGVLISLKLPDGTGQTHSVLHDVLVTQVQGGTAAGDGKQSATSGGSNASGASGGSNASGPGSSLMITLAVTARQAEAVVFGQEHGTIWLSLEPKGADTSGTSVVTNGNVYTGAY